jgi:glycosyltransferase involved in cell wall biosynthesis
MNPRYQWDVIRGAEGFERHTLFMNNAEAKDIRDIAHRVYATLDNVNPEVVAIPGWQSKFSLIALDWCLRNRIPSILLSESTYNDFLRKKWVEKIKSHIVRLFDSGFVGGTESAYYLEKLGLPKERVFCGYDVVENDHFRTAAEAVRENSTLYLTKLGLPDKYFLANGRFVAKKNLLFLIEAYAIYVSVAGRDSWKLVLVGDGPLRQCIETLIHELGLQDSVSLLGFRQYAELPYYYGLAGAFIHASTSEQWGLVVNEAMASSLPLLVSNRCGCVPDLLHEGVNGFSFDPDDLGQLSELMFRVSSGSIDVRAMGRSSLHIISRWPPLKFADGLFMAAASATRKHSGRKHAFCSRSILRALILLPAFPLNRNM